MYSNIYTSYVTFVYGLAFRNFCHIPVPSLVFPPRAESQLLGSDNAYRWAFQSKSPADERIAYYDFRCWLSRQRFNASSQSPEVSPHLSVTKPHVRARTICSTLRSLRIRCARDSVRASRGKNRAEYGSRRSSTTRSRSFADSVSLRIRSGSSGSGLVATPAQ